LRSREPRNDKILKMSGFDDLGLFFVDTFATDENTQDASKMSLMSVKKKLKDFLRVFHTGNFNYVYRFVIGTC
jgi:DNA replication licensing factor MCM5